MQDHIAKVDDKQTRPILDQKENGDDDEDLKSANELMDAILNQNKKRGLVKPAPMEDLSTEVDETEVGPKSKPSKKKSKNDRSNSFAIVQ